MQDDFRLNDRLTLNMGLRWDAQVSRNERYNRLSYFDPDAASPLAAKVGISNLTGGLRFLGVDGKNRQQATDWNNVGPRLGFSWQATAKTVFAHPDALQRHVECRLFGYHIHGLLSGRRTHAGSRVQQSVSGGLQPA